MMSLTGLLDDGMLADAILIPRMAKHFFKKYGNKG